MSSLGSLQGGAGSAWQRISSSGKSFLVSNKNKNNKTNDGDEEIVLPTLREVSKRTGIRIPHRRTKKATENTSDGVDSPQKSEGTLSTKATQECQNELSYGGGCGNLDVERNLQAIKQRKNQLLRTRQQQQQENDPTIRKLNAFEKNDDVNDKDDDESSYACGKYDRYAEDEELEQHNHMEPDSCSVNSSLSDSTTSIESDGSDDEEDDDDEDSTTVAAPSVKNDETTAKVVGKDDDVNASHHENPPTTVEADKTDENNDNINDVISITKLNITACGAFNNCGFGNLNLSRWANVKIPRQNNEFDDDESDESDDEDSRESKDDDDDDDDEEEEEEEEENDDDSSCRSPWTGPRIISIRSMNSNESMM